MGGRTSDSFHAQLASIVEVLANTAVAEVCRLVDDGYALLRLEISHNHREIDALRRRLLLAKLQGARRHGPGDRGAAPGDRGGLRRVAAAAARSRRLNTGREKLSGPAAAEEDPVVVKDHCRSLGGSLASVHNHAENRYLKDLLQLTGQTDVWIGAFYLQSRWRWIDGTGMYFTNWISTSSSTSAPCTCLRRSGWAKASCASSMRFFCAQTPGC
ncbi:hypothetical protein CRUP_026729 [Coryphaenoides rupestris]|nr:hypothetical protein CRUP_026729 [Coryphaenoides rupestris]